MKKNVAIIIPTHKENLKEYEKLSINLLNEKLKKYDKFLVVPESFDEKKCLFDLSLFNLKKLPNKYFSSHKEYNNLLRTSFFYKQFRKYNYILIYQTDCLVFKDELEYFCSLDYDYIGAPFIKNQLKKIKDKNKIKVRNGGFSLRKVDSFIKITEEYEKKNFKNSWFLKYYLTHFLDYNIGIIKGVIKRKINMYNLFTTNEDIFWSFGAKSIHPEFKVAPFDISLAFSFENNIPLSFKMNHNKIPFGAHAFQCEKNLKEWEKIGVLNKSIPKIS